MYPNIRICICVYIYIYYGDISWNMIITFLFFKYTEFTFQLYKYKFFLNSAQTEFQTVQFQKTKLDTCMMHVTVLDAATFTAVIDPY
jgi:hypothetical protein